jgi:hypothetical protein
MHVICNEYDEKNGGGKMMNQVSRLQLAGDRIRRLLRVLGSAVSHEMKGIRQAMEAPLSLPGWQHWMARLLMGSGLAALMLTLSACDLTADVKNPKRYDTPSLSFQYPGNWKVESDGNVEFVRSIFVQTNSKGFFAMQVYPEDRAVSLHEYSRWYSKLTADETPVASVDGVTFSDEGVQPASLGDSPETEEAAAVAAVGPITETFNIELLTKKYPYLRRYHLVAS